jgi:hypothetical protein
MRRSRMLSGNKDVTIALDLAALAMSFSFLFWTKTS